MFGLFKRTKIEDWEKEILQSIFLRLPNDYEKYNHQLELGLLRGVMVGVSDIPNYVGFTYFSKVYNKFYNPKGNNYKLSNIRVFDKVTNEYINMSIYFGYGVINGYSIDTVKAKKIKPDMSKIILDFVKKQEIGEDDSVKILHFLSSEERSFIDINDIYATIIEDKDYYHLKELEDGDFIGIDLDNNIYKITHDPFQLSLLEREDLLDFLKINK